MISFPRYIDVQGTADFRKIGELQQLLKALAMRMGNKLDYTKLSQIIGISRPTLNDYPEFLEKTYVVYQLPAYAGPDKAVALGKKLYFRDNGTASILAHPGEGALLKMRSLTSSRNTKSWPTYQKGMSTKSILF
jgi:predicted AAA+ superfamily ATPase